MNTNIKMKNILKAIRLSSEEIEMIRAISAVRRDIKLSESAIIRTAILEMYQREILKRA